MSARAEVFGDIVHGSSIAGGAAPVSVFASSPTAKSLAHSNVHVVREEFAPYIKLVDFLDAIMGPRSEIALHDLSDFSRSIIALSNGHISGRSVGGPATNLVLKGEFK